MSDVGHLPSKHNSSFSRCFKRILNKIQLGEKVLQATIIYDFERKYCWLLPGSWAEFINIFSLLSSISIKRLAAGWTILLLEWILSEAGVVCGLMITGHPLVTNQEMLPLQKYFPFDHDLDFNWRLDSGSCCDDEVLL